MIADELSVVWPEDRSGVSEPAMLLLLPLLGLLLVVRSLSSSTTAGRVDEAMCWTMAGLATSRGGGSVGSGGVGGDVNVVTPDAFTSVAVCAGVQVQVSSTFISTSFALG